MTKRRVETGRGSKKQKDGPGTVRRRRPNPQTRGLTLRSDLDLPNRPMPRSRTSRSMLTKHAGSYDFHDAHARTHAAARRPSCIRTGKDRRRKERELSV